MYEDWTQNYDPEIHEEYLIPPHDTPFPLPHHLSPSANYSIAVTQLIRLKGTIFCCDCEPKIWIFKVFLKKSKKYLTFGLLRFFL